MSGGHEEGTGLPPGVSCLHRRSPAAPRGVGVRGAPPGGLGLVRPGSQPRACWQQVPLLDPGRLLPVLLTSGIQLPSALFSQPYVPRDPPVLRVTEGPFSEVVACYEHVHQVVRQQPGRVSPADGERGQGGVAPWAVTHSCSCPLSVCSHICPQKACC